jgi:hypothetical protein
LARLAVRTAAGGLGAVAVFLAGYLGYRAYIGSFSPRELVQPTLDFVRSNDELAAPLQRPVREFLDGEPRIYAPVLLCIALAAMLGRRLIEDTLPGRLAQYAIGYVALLWLYRFAVTSSVLETWWAYNMAAISMCFAVPLVLDRLERAESRRGAMAILGAALLGAGAASLVIRNANSSAVDVYERIRDDAALVVVLLLMSGIAVVGMRFLRGWLGRALATGAFFALVAFVALTPARYIGINQT